MSLWPLSGSYGFLGLKSIVNYFQPNYLMGGNDLIVDYYGDVSNLFSVICYNEKLL